MTRDNIIPTTSEITTAQAEYMAALSAHDAACTATTTAWKAIDTQYSVLLHKLWDAGLRREAVDTHPEMVELCATYEALKAADHVLWAPLQTAATKLLALVGVQAWKYNDQTVVPTATVQARGAKSTWVYAIDGEEARVSKRSLPYTAVAVVLRAIIQGEKISVRWINADEYSAKIGQLQARLAKQPSRMGSATNDKVCMFLSRRAIPITLVQATAKA